MNQTNTVVIMQQKSVLVSLLLSFFFGPLGMLYSTILGAIIMLIITVPVAVFTAGIGLIFTVPICMIWSFIAIKTHNSKLMNLATSAAI